jgi:predicted TIM-barrel fold metal-dependent hydrolase
MQAPGFFSADSHVNEPPEAWERIPSDLRERGPHFVQDPGGKKGLYMVFEGHEPDPVGMTFTAGVGRERGAVQKVIENFTWDQWKGPWDPKARVPDMDRDGVRAEVLYPSMARNFYSLSGDEVPLQLAGLKSYNDWLIEYCKAVPGRLYGVGLLSPLDVDWSVAELKRCARIGHKGVLLPAGLPGDATYADPKFEPIWAALEDMDVPLHFHINVVQGADRMATRLKKISMHQTGKNAVKRAVLESLNLITDLVFGLVLDRHPRLRVVFAEYDLSWVLPFMAKMDGSVRRANSENPQSPAMSTLPSEIIRRQVYITFQEDPAGVAGAQAIGLLDNCLWASDYPHGGSTWPRSQEIVKSQLGALDPATASKLVWENAARLYGVA